MMAEEEKTEQPASSEQDLEASEAQEQEQVAQEEVDYKSRYEELQKQHTEVSQKAKENEQLLEMISPHVDWNAAQGRQAPATETPSEGYEGEEEFVSKKAHEEALRKAQEQTDIKLLTMQFRTNHPDLVPYEHRLVVPEVLRLRREKPHLTADKLIEEAAKAATDFLEQERTKGRAAVEAEAEEKRKKEEQAKAEVAKASGFASAGKTSPAKEEKPGETAQEYLAWRKEQSRKSRGL